MIVLLQSSDRVRSFLKNKQTTTKKTKRKKKYYICEHNPETCNYISWNKPKIGEKWEPEKEKEVTKPKRKTRKKK
mgnify:CR=1 FL=1